MTDLRPTITPKSDQLNADDLIGRSITIKVQKVSLRGEADQPIAIHYEGDGGKPYLPCKSMRRVMVHVWGPDGAKFAGRRMTLYRDDKVTFGKEAVGGIRISHMSGIDREVTMALTATRANRKPYTVKPLPTDKAEPTESVDLLTVLTTGREAAARGSAALTAWWSRLDRDEKAAAKPTLDSELKAAASKADQAALDDPADHDSETGEVTEGDSFPGDRSGEGATESAEPSGNDETGSVAFDHIAWADGFIADLPFLTKEQLDALETNKLELARFAQLKVLSVDKAKEFEDALKEARGAFS